MEVTPHPFYTLRQEIRHAGKQFRNNDDTSDSLFHPKGGFVTAYDVKKVEAALDLYEEALGSEYQEQRPALSPEEQLKQEAKSIKECHPSIDARKLAIKILDYLGDKEVKVNPLRAIRSHNTLDVDQLT